MQVLFSSSSPPPSPQRPSKVSYSHRHISVKARRIPRALTPISDANFPSVAMVAASSRPNSRLGVVDLTDSPSTSPCSSDAALMRSTSRSSNSSAPKVARSRSPARPFPPPSFSGFHSSCSSPSFPGPPSALAPIYLAPPTRSDSPRNKRATFLLPGDSDSDRERDRDGEPHDDSDDSDRTSFFSAEEFVVPARALYTTGGRILDKEFSKSECQVTTWQTQEPQVTVEATPEERDIQPDRGQDAAHELRRWHALMEVVHSEVSYVRDLRVLVKVYLSLLPALPLSFPALQAVRELARDAVDLLGLHERFSRALQVVCAQVAGGTSTRGSVDEAVRQLARLFVDESSAFDLYQRFCSAQPDVLRLLRPAQARAEWATFERRCATGGQDADPECSATEHLVQDQSDTLAGSSAASQNAKCSSPRTMLFMPSAFKAHALSSPPADVPQPSNPRRHSYDSLAGVFGAGSGSIRHRPGIARPLSDTPARSATSTPPAAPSQNSRLRFQDFLIKPVQRICKYPLMLEALRSKARGDPANAIVASAVETMRAVAMRVDEARRKREAAVKSELIVKRIQPHTVVTPAFLSSLGDCLLAGSLDVVHHHHALSPITTPVRVKYLGGFLYSGGYLLLVKVGKGKTYRVRHWFSLAPFEIVDIPQDNALVPFSFRLSYMDHHFEIAAACKREKDLWLRAINEARSAAPPWDSEPISSLQILQAAPALTPLSSGGNGSETVEAPVPLKRGISSASMNETSNPLSMLLMSSTRFRHPASVFAPTPTIRYIFSHTEESSVLLHRSSSGNRNIVDHGLSDVSSDLIAGLRKQSQARQETLFPPPKLSDASQTIATAAKNKLMRRGSVVMARSRGSGIPGSASISTDRDEDPRAPKAKSAHSRRMALLPALNLLYTEPESITAGSQSAAADADLRFSKPESSLEDVPSPSSMTRSLTVSTGRRTPQSAPPEVTVHNPHCHRRARSVVGSVKGLMRLGSIRSSTAQEPSDAWRIIRHQEDSSSDKLECDSTDPDSHFSTGRRRVSSAPTSPPLSSANPTFFPYSDQESSTASTSPSSPLLPPIDSLSPSGTSGSKLFRKKSAPNTPNPDQTLKPRRSFKNFVFYNRLSTVDPA